MLPKDSFHTKSTDASIKDRKPKIALQKMTEYFVEFAKKGLLKHGKLMHASLSELVILVQECRDDCCNNNERTKGNFRN